MHTATSAPGATPRLDQPASQLVDARHRAARSVSVSSPEANGGRIRRPGRPAPRRPRGGAARGSRARCRSSPRAAGPSVASGDVSRAMRSACAVPDAAALAEPVTCAPALVGASVPRNSGMSTFSPCRMPSRDRTAPTVRTRMARSMRRSWWSTYSTSRANFCSQVSALRPLTWARPVMPGPDLVPARLLGGVPRQVRHHQGSRSDEAHVALDDVPQLGQLVQAEGRAGR